MLAWLASRDIRSIIVEPLPREVEPHPPVRASLIAEVLASAGAARQLSGVVHIAFTGSVATKKPDPKDADLKPLAALGLKLQSHTQSLGLGGEVFLAAQRRHYRGEPAPGSSVD